jgi:predicted SprT family Zn-dependent metalloprotease
VQRADRSERGDQADLASGTDKGDCQTDCSPKPASPESGRPAPARISPTRLARLRATLNRWSQLWGVEALGERVQIVTTTRLRVSLARAQPRPGRIALHPDLLRSPARLERVLCHEAAHLAAYELHGPRIRPHGPEWQRLVKLAGHIPEVRGRSSRPREALARPTTRARWEHRCPVCQMLRVARRHVSAWRCAACVAAGLEGQLEIHRVEEER